MLEVYSVVLSVRALSSRSCLGTGVLEAAARPAVENTWK